MTTTRVSGTGDATVVFLNGLATPSAEWDDVTDALESRATLVRFDRRRSHGPGPVPARTAVEMVEELAAVIDALPKKPRVVLVGHSWGGVVGRLYAHHQPEHVAGLVLVDATPANQSAAIAPTGRLYQLMALLSRHRLTRPFVLSLVVPRKAPAGYRRTIDELVRDPDTWRTAQAELAGVPASLELLRRSCPGLPPVPTVILTAGASGGRLMAGVRAKVLAEWQQLAAAAPRANCRQVSRSGHYISLERPDAVVDAIHEVLDLAYSAKPVAAATKASQSASFSAVAASPAAPCP